MVFVLLILKIHEIENPLLPLFTKNPESTSSIDVLIGFQPQQITTHFPGVKLILASCAVV